MALLAWQASLPLALIVVYQWAALNHAAVYRPPIEQIAEGYLRLWHGDLFHSAMAPSLCRLAAGFAIALLLGCAGGVVLGSLRDLDPWLRPTIEYFRFIPAVAILPASLILFGATDEMRIFVIAFGSVFPVLLAATDGARRVDPLLIDVARVNGLSTAERLVRVVLPAAAPSIFAGARVALSIALVMMVISELIAADDGLGFYILRSQRLFQTANVYAGVLAIGTIGLVLTLALLSIEKRVLAWHHGWRELKEAHRG
jgi:ABC-type nitrate/sulfonate/bicarbonate transport system permease component